MKRIAGNLSDGAIAVMVVALGFSINMIGRGTGNTYVAFLVPLDQDYGWSRTATASVYSVFMLASGLSATFAGMIFDRLGPRIIYSVGLALMGCAYLLASHMDTLWQLYLLVGLISGFAVSALGMIPASALISRWYPKNDGKSIGLAYAGLGAGNLLMVPFAQILIETDGWRFGYFVLGSILLIGLFLIMFLPWQRMAAGSSEHRASMASTEKEQNRLKLLKNAMKTTQYWGLAAIVFFASFSVYLVTIQTIIFLVDNDFSGIEAATAFGLAGMLSVVGMISVGWLMDRLGAKRFIGISLIFTLIGILLLDAISYEPTHWLLWLYVLIFGLAQGVRGPVVSTLSSRFFYGPAHATIYGSISGLGFIGAALGAFTSGLLYDLTSAYRVGFVVAMVTLFFGAVPLWFLKTAPDETSSSGQ